MKIMILKWSRQLIVAWTFVVLWMILIFCLSSQNAEQSSGLSLSITEWISKWFGTLPTGTGTNSTMLQILNRIVRKTAHGFAYFVLAIFVFRAFLLSSRRQMKAFFYALPFVFGYACTDELHQMFVPGRGARISDVLIDCTGGLLGIAIYMAMKTLLYHKTNKIADR